MMDWCNVFNARRCSLAQAQRYNVLNAWWCILAQAQRRSPPQAQQRCASNAAQSTLITAATSAVA